MATERAVENSVRFLRSGAGEPHNSQSGRRACTTLSVSPTAQEVSKQLTSILSSLNIYRFNFLYDYLFYLKIIKVIKN
jgi:hypothetical protein